MIEVRLSDREVFPWRKAGSVSVRGELAGRGLPPLAPSDSAWGKILRATAGSFALVLEGKRSLLAAVDRCRSFPVFYAVRDGRLIVGDDARRVRASVRDTEPDEIALAEALVSGFVSGNATLFPRLKQLRAGEMLRAGEENGSISIDVETWDHRDRSDAETTAPAAERQRIESLEACVARVSQRLFESLQGRFMVIPLTGGFDSRLVAILAKRAHYRRVLCLGSQARTGWEARTSREVAGRLGFEWVHFGYEPHRWPGWYRCAERRRYYRDADGLCGLPPLVEWPAVLELSRSGKVPRDAVIVPGHFGDFVAGSSTPAGGEDEVETILRERYSLNRWPDMRSEKAVALLARVRAGIRQAARGSRDGQETIDRWEWKEFQTKRRGAAVRIYESCGYEWRLPLADPELVSFWRDAPWEERLGNRLYHRYVEELGRRWHLPEANPGVGGSGHLLRRQVRRLGLLGPARRLRLLLRSLDRRALTREDAVGWSSLLDRREVRRTFTGLEGVESYLVRDWLRDLDP